MRRAEKELYEEMSLFGRKVFRIYTCGRIQKFLEETCKLYMFPKCHVQFNTEQKALVSLGPETGLFQGTVQKNQHHKLLGQVAKHNSLPRLKKFMVTVY